MATIRSFEELEIWKEARKLYKKILAITDKPEIKKDYRFSSQMTAAAGSVMDNIAEGFERDSKLEFVNFLSYSKGSTGEPRSQLSRGFDNQYWDENIVNEINLEYKTPASHIANFIRYLNQSEHKGQKFKDRKS